MANFFIRPIEDADLAAVLEAYRQSEDFLALGPAAAASLEMIAADRALSAREGGTYCGIFVPDRLAGILDYTLHAPARPGTLFIELLMLARAERGHGLGTAVVERLLAEYPGQSLAAAVQVNNPGAVRFWQRMGFTITGPAELQTDGTVTFPLERAATRGPGGML